MEMNDDELRKKEELEKQCAFITRQRDELEGNISH